MNFFSNLAFNMRSPGISAIVCVWTTCITMIAVHGEGDLAKLCVGALSVFGGFLLGAIGIGKCTS